MSSLVIGIWGSLLSVKWKQMAKRCYLLGGYIDERNMYLKLFSFFFATDYKCIIYKKGGILGTLHLYIIILINFQYLIKSWK